MPRIKIEGNHLLSGTIDISGAKNSAVALIPASLLCDEKVSISNIPKISDIDALEEILKHLNIDVKKEDDIIFIDTKDIINKGIPGNLAEKLRASYYFMGALLGKFKKVDIYFPGGCNIGDRPINLHLKGFESLGAKIKEENNHFLIEATELRGNRIYLDVPSVGATINIMLAAVKATGETIIENAAKEPEIVNIATFLNNMGAKIKGAGTSVIKIDGVNYLRSCFHEVIPDRIEAGTYLIAGSLLGNNLKINKIIPSHLEALLSKLKEIGVNLQIEADYIIVNKNDNLKATSLKTLVYPGFPTDLQQPFSTLLTQCHGISNIEETIYENRFNHVSYLNNMGAKISLTDKQNIKVEGKTTLEGKEVIATDLRAGAALVIAGLIANKTTYVDNIHYILRGYDNIIQKLKNVGAKISIEEI